MVVIYTAPLQVASQGAFLEGGQGGFQRVRQRPCRRTQEPGVSLRTWEYLVEAGGLLRTPGAGVGAVQAIQRRAAQRGARRRTRRRERYQAHRLLQRDGSKGIGAASRREEDRQGGRNGRCDPQGAAR